MKQRRVLQFILIVAILTILALKGSHDPINLYYFVSSLSLTALEFAHHFIPFALRERQAVWWLRTYLIVYPPSAEIFQVVVDWTHLRGESWTSVLEYVGDRVGYVVPTLVLLMVHSVLTNVLARSFKK